jgi:hypothetical protein
MCAQFLQRTCRPDWTVSHVLRLFMFYRWTRVKAFVGTGKFYYLIIFLQEVKCDQRKLVWTVRTNIEPKDAISSISDRQRWRLKQFLRLKWKVIVGNFEVAALDGVASSQGRTVSEEAGEDDPVGNIEYSERDGEEDARKTINLNGSDSGASNLWHYARPIDRFAFGVLFRERQKCLSDSWNEISSFKSFSQVALWDCSMEQKVTWSASSCCSLLLADEALLDLGVLGTSKSPRTMLTRQYSISAMKTNLIGGGGDGKSRERGGYWTARCDLHGAGGHEGVDRFQIGHWR